VIFVGSVVQLSFVRKEKKYLKSSLVKCQMLYNKQIRMLALRDIRIIVATLGKTQLPPFFACPPRLKLT